MSQSEIDATWYGPNDSHHLKKDVKRNVRRMRSSENSDNDHSHIGSGLHSEKYCYRGIEHLSQKDTGLVCGGVCDAIRPSHLIRPCPWHIHRLHANMHTATCMNGAAIGMGRLRVVHTRVHYM